MFWSRLKMELLDGGSFRNPADARSEISHYLANYNAERRHSVLGYFAPNHFETHFQTTSQLCAAYLDHLTAILLHKLWESLMVPEGTPCWAVSKNVQGIA
ncbi:integrase core domain-containing protein [Hymenobacter sp. M29]|uniref:Integrase core domain-containing protein n=1 Tax=Hymenobacter mellowenesis TaxID=3063995 RepID=A0ABT9AI06_9BACT|nr:integrase core domain-containing protein [Hymenobacter sp. M29]MDO7848586.1 integrase core domain-containing protein [Hymenobacter sp. M29]